MKTSSDLGMIYTYLKFGLLVWDMGIDGLDSYSYLSLFEVSEEVGPSVWQDHCHLLSRVSEGGLQEDDTEHHPGQQEHLQLTQVPAVLLRHTRLRRLHSL